MDKEIKKCEDPFRKRYDMPIPDCEGYIEGMEECEDGDYVEYEEAIRHIKSSLNVITELTREKYEAEHNADILKSLLKDVIDCACNSCYCDIVKAAKRKLKETT